MIYTVRIQPRPDEEERYTEEKKYRQDQLDKAKWLNRISAIGAGIAFAALLALVWYACLTQEANGINKSAFDRAYRPYIGVNGVVLEYGYQDSTGTLQTSKISTPKTNIFGFSVDVKNFGPVPGLNYVGTWRVFIGNEEQPQHKTPDSPFKFFPGQVQSLRGQIGGPVYTSVVSGQKQLILEVTVEYDFPGGHTKECEKKQFDRDFNDFLNLGACAPR